MGDGGERERTSKKGHDTREARTHEGHRRDADVRELKKQKQEGRGEPEQGGGSTGKGRPEARWDQRHLQRQRKTQRPPRTESKVSLIVTRYGIRLLGPPPTPSASTPLITKG